MPTESAVAYVSIVPVARGARRAIEQQINPGALGTSVGSQMSSKFLKSVGSMALTSTKIIGGAAAAIGGTIAGIAAKKGMDRLLSIDDAQGKLKGLGNTTDQISTIMDSALASVKGTAFGLGDAATVASNAVAAGIKPGQDLTKYLTLTADAASIAGVSLDEMGSIINKTTTSGKVYTDNLNQLADRGIPIFTWLQKEYGVSADALSKMVSDGKVDAETFRKVIQENIGGAAQASGKTVRGAYANMLAALGRVGAAFLTGGVSAAPALLTSITKAIDAASASAAPFAETFSTKVGGAMQRVSTFIDGIDFTKLFADFQSITASSPLVLALKALSPLLPIIRDAAGQLAPILGKLAAAFGGALAGVVISLMPSIEKLLPIVVQLVEQFGGVFLDAMIKLTPVFTSLAMIASELLIALAPLAGVLGEALVAALNAALPLITDLANILAPLTGWLSENTSLTTTLAAAVLGGAAAYKIWTGATKAWSLATKIAAGAQRLFNLALAMNPIGLIIVAIGALVAGLVWFFTQTKLGQAIVQTVFAAIQVAVGAVGDAFVWLWDKAIKPAWDGIAAGAKWLWETILKPVFDAIAGAVEFVVGVVVAYVKLWIAVFTAIGNAVAYVYSNYIDPIFQLIGAIVTKVVGPAFQWLWESVISPVFSWIGDKISTWWAAVKIVFGVVVSFIRDTLGAIFTWLWESVISPVFGFIGLLISSVWNNTIKPIFDAVAWVLQNVLGPVFKWLYEKVVKPVWDSISRAIKFVWENGIKPIVDKLKFYFGEVLPLAFQMFKDGVADAWKKIQDAAKAPIRFVVNTVINDGIIDNFNKVAGFFGTKKMPRVTLPKGFANGGYTGNGGKWDPAGIVHRGEFVFTKEQTERLGVGRLAAIARNGYANGGLVGAATNAWDWLAGKSGKAWNWAKNAAETAASVVSDPEGTLGRLVKSMIGNIPGGGAMLDVAQSIGRKILEGATSALSDIGGAAGVFGGNGQNGQIPSTALSKAQGFAPGPGVGPTGGLLQKAAAGAWNAAQAASGGALRLTEGYRDLAAQQYRWSLFKKGGNLAATPGTSIHGFGLAADVAGGQAWLRANGSKYGWANTGLGFSQREPWHFEFKGMRNIPQLANGAFVKHTPGGSLVTVGEGRYDEAVVPLSPDLKGVLAGTGRRSSEGRTPIQLTLVSSGSIKQDLDEVDHKIETMRRGGRLD